MRLESLGTDRGRGNLLGVEPLLAAGDYRSAETLEAALDGCLREARESGLLGERTVAVFPEYIGAWLVAAGAPERAFRATRTTDAMRAIASRRPLAFLWRLAVSRAADRSADSLLRLRAAAAARDYQQVFSRLARRYGVTTVAGSIILPEPRVSGGVLRPGDGPLANTSVVFGPDGSILQPLVRKCHPTAEELGFVDRGAAVDLPSFRTPAGPLGVLVCADSWFPDCWARMRELAVELVAVVSFSRRDGSWGLPWRGYSGAVLPPDVGADDVGKLSEAQAWRRHALAGRIGSSGARCGINVFLRGSLWDLGSDGRTTMVRDGEVKVLEPAGPSPGSRCGGTLASCWIP
jgi:predicted amidohydrolase